MKKYYIAFFPEIDERHWVSKFRDQYDPKSQFIAPHLTLFFPSEFESFDELSAEVERVTSNTKKFKVIFRAAMMMPELGSCSIFLVPSEGFSEVLRLHSLLYAEKYAHLLRLDIPFVPHMTIGSNLSLSEGKKLVDKLNSKQFELKFILDRLSIVEISDSNKCRKIVSNYAVS